MAFAIRRLFAANGKRLIATYEPLAPVEVDVDRNLRYGNASDALLDVYVPRRARPGQRLPTIVWVHGGGFVGGSREELGYYLRWFAAEGFTCVAIDYTLAPAARYPTPARQVMLALRYIQEHGARLHVDPRRLVLAGDSAGAHIAAQAALIATSPAYQSAIAMTSTVKPDQLRGVILCCGPFDLDLLDTTSQLRDLVRAMAWSYTGQRDYRDNRLFLATSGLPRHVTPAFPPAFVTVGNADPLQAHSVAMTTAFASSGVDFETLFYPDDPTDGVALGHEYQFELDLPEAQVALRRIVDFARRHTTIA
jgi:acetyl esterase/lipase